MERRTAFVFDLDGTLVDSVYQHVLAWQQALEAVGIELAVWRIHRRIGMSGGLFINALLRETEEGVTAEQVARIQALHAQAYTTLAPQVRPLPGARELLATLTAAGVPWGIATSGRLHPMQQAFHDNHALQCGYCTPGLVMQALDILRDNPNPSEDQIRVGLEGNLCRCTGYHNIVKAVSACASTMAAGGGDIEDDSPVTTTSVSSTPTTAGTL